ncbi:unnamed protein product, partial [Mycena citricolor]
VTLIRLTPPLPNRPLAPIFHGDQTCIRATQQRLPQVIKAMLCMRFADEVAEPVPHGRVREAHRIHAVQLVVQRNREDRPVRPEAHEACAFGQDVCGPDRVVFHRERKILGCRDERRCDG